MPDDFNPNMPEPIEESDEPDYDLELDWLSLLETYRPCGKDGRPRDEICWVVCADSCPFLISSVRYR
jgi:hypothetical protein